MRRASPYQPSRASDRSPAPGIPEFRGWRTGRAEARVQCARSAVPSQLGASIGRGASIPIGLWRAWGTGGPTARASPPDAPAGHPPDARAGVSRGRQTRGNGTRIPRAWGPRVSKACRGGLQAWAPGTRVPCGTGHAGAGLHRAAGTGHVRGRGCRRAAWGTLLKPAPGITAYLGGSQTGRSPGRASRARRMQFRAKAWVVPAGDSARGRSSWPRARCRGACGRPVRGTRRPARGDLRPRLASGKNPGRDGLGRGWRGVRAGSMPNPRGSGLDLSGSWRQGHSATYSAPSRIQVVCKGFCPPPVWNCAPGQPPTANTPRAPRPRHEPFGAMGPYCGSGGERRAGAPLH